MLLRSAILIISLIDIGIFGQASSPSVSVVHVSSETQIPLSSLEDSSTSTQLPSSSTQLALNITEVSSKSAQESSTSTQISSEATQVSSTQMSLNATQESSTSTQSLEATQVSSTSTLDSMTQVSTVISILPPASTLSSTIESSVTEISSIPRYSQIPSSILATETTGSTSALLLEPSALVQNEIKNLPSVSRPPAMEISVDAPITQNKIKNLPSVSRPPAMEISVDAPITPAQDANQPPSIIAPASMARNDNPPSIIKDAETAVVNNQLDRMDASSSNLLLLGSSSKAEVGNLISDEQPAIVKTPGSDNSKIQNPSVITIPPVKTNPGQSVNESKDESQNTNAPDVGMIVGITAGVLVACVLGYLVLNRKVKPDDNDAISYVDSEAPLDNHNIFISKSNPYGRSSPQMENDYDRTSGAFNPFAPPPAAQDLLNSNYSRAPGNAHIATPFARPVKHLSSHSDQNTVTGSQMSTVSYLKSDISPMPFVAPPTVSSQNTTKENQFQKEALYTIERHPVKDLGHLSVHTNDDMNNTTYSMFLQNESRSFEELHVDSDDELVRENFEEEVVSNPAHLSLGTILSEGSSDGDIIGMKYGNMDNEMGSHPITESSIITSMNYQSIYSAPDSDMAVYSLAEQAKLAAGTEGFQRDNMYDSVMF